MIVDVRFPLRVGAAAALLALALTAVPVPVAAQGIPDDFTNLEVLPEDISRRELVGIMRRFSGALGVRCTYCHTVSDDLDSPDDDFASDEKAPKEKARAMMANWTKSVARTLTLAPTSHSKNPPFAEGNHVQMAGRRTPGMRSSRNSEAESNAPVLPALTIPWALPSFTSCTARTRDESGLVLTIREGWSSRLTNWPA